MKRRDYLKTATYAQKYEEWEKLKLMLKDIAHYFPDGTRCTGNINVNTVNIYIGNLHVVARITDDVINIHETGQPLHPDAEKLIRVAIPYWMNQEVGVDIPVDPDMFTLVNEAAFKKAYAAELANGNFVKELLFPDREVPSGAVRLKYRWLVSSKSDDCIITDSDDKDENPYFDYIPGGHVDLKKAAYAVQAEHNLAGMGVNIRDMVIRCWKNHLPLEVMNIISISLDGASVALASIDGNIIHYHCDSGNDW